ncbi:MAG: hypothetical protein IIY04_06170 [Oscillospiraceae bacterium]|nr:hypothetical protein [Oscillospiraceae bacterium]
MQKIYTETFLLRPAQCDMKNQWRPSAILEIMQDTAGMHSIDIGVDRETLIKENSLVWVITRLHVEMSRMPSAGETITIETYPTTPRHMFYPRSHIFRDEKGEVIGTANSLWVTMDIHSRRIAKSEFVEKMMPDNSDLSPASGMPATVRAMPGDIETGTIEPSFTDLDINEHVNNTKYLDWCLNALGIETMKKKRLHSFDVNYDQEIRPGDSIRTELTRDGDRFAFSGFGDDKKRFSIGGLLIDRD